MTRDFWYWTILFCLLIPGNTATVLAQEPEDTFVFPELEEEDEFDLLLLKEPTTPEGLLKTAYRSMRLGRYDRSRTYLQQLLLLKPDDKTLLDLQKKVGDLLFLRMARNKELHPESDRLLDQVHAAMERYKNNPDRIKEIIDLLEGTPEERELAVFRLKTVGEPAVPFLVSRIVNDSGENRELYTQTLTLMGRHAISPMIAALQSTNEEVRVSAIEVLRFTKAKYRAAPRMLWLAYYPEIETGTRQLARETLQEWKVLSGDQSESTKRSTAAEMLSQLSLDHFRKSSNYEAQQLEADLWLWDEEAGTVLKSTKSQAEASQILGTIQAHQAMQLAPDNKEYQSILLGFVLAGEHKQIGEQFKPANQQSAHNLALSLGPALVLKTLAASLKNQNSSAAYAALNVLKEQGSAQLLYLADSPILDALNYSDSGVQFAAVEAILTFEPHEPFPNSSRIVPILARKVTTTNYKTAVVVGANRYSTTKTRDLFNELMFDTVATATGRAGFKYAATNREVDLIVLRENTVHWPMSQTVANIRADARTASIPIVIYGSLELQKRVEMLQQKFDAIEFVQDTVESKTMREAVNRALNTRRTQSPLSEEERRRHQERAAYWLAQLAQLQDNSMFDLNQAEKPLLIAMEDEQIIGNALITLSAISTKNAQSTLAQYVISDRTDDRVRSAAVEQLKKHVQRFGLLIDDREVLLLKRLRQQNLNRELSNKVSALMGQLKLETIHSAPLLDNFAKGYRAGIAR